MTSVSDIQTPSTILKVNHVDGPPTDIVNHNDPNSTHIFRLVTNTVAPIKHLMELLRDLLTEGVFECSDKGIRLYKTNQDETCIVYMKLEADKFDDFYCKNTISLPMRMDCLFRVIKLVENGETLSMYVDESDEHVLVVDRYNSSEHFRNSKYIRTIESTEDPETLSKMNYKNIIKMNSTRFQKICKELSQFGQRVSITSTATTLSFKTDDDGDNYIPQEIQFLADDDELGISYASHDDETFNGIFTLKHLLQFSKCANLAENVLIYSKNEEYLTIQSDIMNLGRINICLAPIEIE